MLPGRWDRIKDLFEAALELEPLRRAEFLQRECLGANSIRLEVEALLEENNRLGSFLNEPLFGRLANQAIPNSPNEILGGFRIVKLLGSGGMGSVYEAYDIALRRRVALKVLNANFSLRKNDLARFEREAWIGGHLHHPNIVKAYGQGEVSGLRFISMELLDGPSLSTDILITKAEWSQGAGSSLRAERIERMILLFSEVADGLHYVHQSGIIHRDIKPHNLLLTNAGSRMLLSDFGLARDDAFSDLTRHGDLFGTIRYMSPEQLLKRKVPLDCRTDLWSLGVSLYEAVTLDLPYKAGTDDSYLSALSLGEPLPARVRNHMVPKDLETVLMKCLEKNPVDRYQSAADLRDDLRRLAVSSPVLARRPGTPLKLKRFAKRHRKSIGVSALACASFLAILIVAFLLTSSARRPLQMTIKPFTTLPGGEYEPKFSPDEKRVAFIWGRDGQTFDLYVQNVDRSGFRRLTADKSSEGSPAWSPDGNSIAFVRYAASPSQSGVYIQSLPGGAERKVTSLLPEEHSFQRRLDWSSDGKYLALADAEQPGQPLAIFLVSPTDGRRVQISTPVPGTQGDTAPVFSPDSKTVAFLRFGASDIDDVYGVPLGGGRPYRITTDNSFISDYAWMPGGRELAVNSKRSGSTNVWVMPLTGGAPRLANGTAGGAYFIAVSPRNQLLAFSMWSADTNIWSVEPVAGHAEKAKFKEIIASTMDDRSAQYSPDGSRIVFRSNQSGTDEIWLADSSGLNQVQLTFFNGPLTGTPRWSNSGESIAFDSRPTGHGDIFVIPRQGGLQRRITTGKGDNVVPSWSSHDECIYFASNRLGDWQIWKVPAQGESALHPAVQLTTRGGFSAFESADGNWIYYTKGREVPGLWRMPAVGGQETPVIPDLQAGYWGYWTLNSSAIYFISCDLLNHCSIQSYSLATKRRSLIVELPKEPPYLDSGLSVSRDAKTFLYPEVDHSESNIMLATDFR